MIFVTIGTQEPFDRLIKAIDELAPSLNMDIVAQVSNTAIEVKNMKALTFIPPGEFDNYFQQASLIISHAGMGSIITALTMNKPIIVMPRLASLGEHRNEHQTATARKFEKLNYVHVVYNESELKSKVIDIVNNGLQPLHQINQFAESELVTSLRNFINGNP